jgi:hypothetical protein
MQSNMSLSIKHRRVHHIGLGHIIQEKTSIKDDLCTVVVISFSDFFAFCFADFF